MKIKKTVLLVDNNLDTLKIMTVILQGEGYTIETAIDGEAALKKVAENQPEVILLDMMLPRIGGVEICRMLKRSPETSRIPVVMMTAKSKDEAQSGAQKAGADGYLLKPFDPADLVDRIKNLCR